MTIDTEVFCRNGIYKISCMTHYRLFQPITWLVQNPTFPS